jgi:hypothetical protein
MTIVAEHAARSPFADTAHLKSRSMQMIIESRVLIARTRVRLDRPDRRRPHIRGGGEPPVRERVRVALANGTLPALNGYRS